MQVPPLGQSMYLNAALSTVDAASSKTAPANPKMTFVITNLPKKLAMNAPRLYPHLTRAPILKHD
jgi:hypothetical protein